MNAYEYCDSNPINKVDPDGREATYAQKKKFVKEVMYAATRISDQTGIPASTFIIQFAMETGYGTGTRTGKHNYSNLGQAKSKTAPFPDYKSDKNFADEYVEWFNKLIADGKKPNADQGSKWKSENYSKALKDGKDDPKAYFDYIGRGGYGGGVIMDPNGTTKSDYFSQAMDPGYAGGDLPKILEDISVEKFNPSGRFSHGNRGVYFKVVDIYVSK